MNDLATLKSQIDRDPPTLPETLRQVVADARELGCGTFGEVDEEAVLLAADLIDRQSKALNRVVLEAFKTGKPWPYSMELWQELGGLVS